jgi:hypothetical protein
VNTPTRPYSSLDHAPLGSDPYRAFTSGLPTIRPEQRSGTSAASAFPVQLTPNRPTSCWHQPPTGEILTMTALHLESSEELFSHGISLL